MFEFAQFGGEWFTCKLPAGEGTQTRSAGEEACRADCFHSSSIPDRQSLNFAKFCSETRRVKLERNFESENTRSNRNLSKINSRFILDSVKQFRRFVASLLGSLGSLCALRAPGNPRNVYPRPPAIVSIQLVSFNVFSATRSTNNNKPLV